MEQGGTIMRVWNNKFVMEEVKELQAREWAIGYLSDKVNKVVRSAVEKEVFGVELPEQKDRWEELFES